MKLLKRVLVPTDNEWVLEDIKRENAKGYYVNMKSYGYDVYEFAKEGKV